MTILLYVGDPFGSSAHSAIAHNLIEALDSLGHRLVCVYEIENQFTYQLPKSKPNVTYVPLCYEAENVTLRQIINQRRNPFGFVKTLFEKAQRKVFNKNRGHKFYGRHLDRECRKHKVDYLICCGNRSRPFDLLYLQYECPSILLFHELPLLKLDGMTESMNTKLLERLRKKGIRFGVRQADWNLFSPFADNAYSIEPDFGI